MAAGWHRDPAGRFEHRYFDGVRWTDGVANAGVASTDPLGAPDAPAPADSPATDPAAAAAAGAGAAGIPGFVSRIEHGRARPVPTLTDALAAAAGVLAAIGVLLIGSGRDLSTGGLIGAAVVLLAGGYGLAISPLGLLRPAATVLVATGIVVLPLVVFRGLTEDAELALPLAVMAVLAVAAYAAPGLRGRPFLLGVALLAVLLTLGWLVLQGSMGEPTVGDSAFSDSTVTNTVVSDTSESVAAMVLIVGAAYVGCTALLDRRGYRGLGTVFAAVGIIGVVLGTSGTYRNLGNVGGALLVVAAGAVLAVVGGIAERRATLWIGVAFVVSGVIGLVAALLNDDPSPAAVGLLILLGGLIVAGVTWLAARRKVLETPSP